MKQLQYSRLDIKSPILDIIDEITSEYLTQGKCKINDINFEVFKFNDELVLTTVVLHDKQIYLSTKNVNDIIWSDFRNITEDFGYEEFLKYIGRN